MPQINPPIAFGQSADCRRRQMRRLYGAPVGFWTVRDHTGLQEKQFVIETHEHNGDFKEWWGAGRATGNGWMHRLVTRSMLTWKRFYRLKLRQSRV